MVKKYAINANKPNVKMKVNWNVVNVININCFISSRMDQLWKGRTGNAWNVNRNLIPTLSQMNSDIESFQKDYIFIQIHIQRMKKNKIHH